MSTTLKIGAMLFALLLVVAVAYEVVPAFADKNGAENPRDNNNNNNNNPGCNPGHPVPCGANPQPNP